MCGRYSQAQKLKDVRERFKLTASDQLELAPRYNIAPSQDAPVVIEEGGRVLKHFRWGLIPSWTKDPSIGHKLVNARAESAAEKPSFKEALRRRRCLVVADGFYEWRGAGKARRPMRIVLPSRRPFAMAGLWESWREAGGMALRTFTILTSPANQFMLPVHDRMPVILSREEEDVWLDPGASQEAVAAVLHPAAQALEMYAVSEAVNSPKNDVPACFEPAQGEPELF